MRTAMAAMALGVVLALAGSARADITFSWLENGSNMGLGVGPVGFTESGATVYATAYSGVTGAGLSTLTSLGSAGPSGGSNDLYAKNGGSGEIGLGLTSDTSGDHEVTVGYGILLNFSSASMHQPYTITFNSNTTSTSGGLESMSVYDASTLKLVGTVTNSNSSSITIGPGATDLKYLVTESSSVSGNPNGLLSTVTLTSETVQSVPEPSTAVLVILGTMGFIGYGLRRRKAQVA